MAWIYPGHFYLGPWTDVNLIKHVADIFSLNNFVIRRKFTFFFLISWSFLALEKIFLAFLTKKKVFWPVEYDNFHFLANFY